MTETTVTASKSNPTICFGETYGSWGIYSVKSWSTKAATELLEIVEKIRETSKSCVHCFCQNCKQNLKTMISSLDPENRHQVIRAFAIYFQLVNIAEQNHRIRRKRDYERSAGDDCAARID